MLMTILRSFRYIYCGQITLTTHSVLGLLVLADKYNVPDLKECCSTYMSHHLVSLACNNSRPFSAVAFCITQQYYLISFEVSSRKI